MKTLKGHDLSALGYLALLTAIVLIGRPPGTLVYLLAHAVAAAVVLGTSTARARRNTPLARVAHYWYVVPFVLCAFRELHYLIPDVRNFDDHRFDRVLADLDRRWLGDVDGFVFRLLTPGLADVLQICYWSYYFSLFALGAILHARGAWEKLDEFVSVVLASLLLSYVGYLVVPAIGPHHFYPQRPPVLDGWLIAGPMHRFMLSLELRMADAFPSGHTLMSLVLMHLAWRHFERRVFWICLPLAVGCVAATVFLRYHYVVDLLASFALFPACVWLGRALNRGTKGTG